MKKYIEFETKQKTNKKTLDVTILNSKGKYILGTIQWHTGFRRYAFYPYYMTVYSDDCLQVIQDKIKELNTNHKKGSDSNGK